MTAQDATAGSVSTKLGSDQVGSDSRGLHRRSFLLASAAGVLAGPTLAQQGNLPPVVLGQVSLSFYAVTGAVVHEMLERLGHPVELREGPHEQMFPLLGESRIDLMAAAWLPEGHGAYWTRYGGQALEVAKLYNGARFFWAVPSYVPEQDVSSIADLAKPAVAERMKKLIQGIGPGATISSVSQKAVAEYGLAPLGYTFRTGTPADWTSALNTALSAQSWVIFPTWAPQFLNRDGKLRPLADPRGVLGTVNHASLVAPRERFDRLPEQTRSVLARIELGLDGVTEMDWLVNVQKQAPRDAARSWMRANEQRVSSWVTG
ncbi:glycine betaine ABC transporter substrate-binding protein [Methylobacterium oxalidis]|uniref:glycine betaine ABC transporter substrate-binding protein n=1 Tax=Methylobacterium oxalidis TaxID=944322 RepID=UPI0033161837